MHNQCHKCEHFTLHRDKYNSSFGVKYSVYLKIKGEFKILNIFINCITSYNKQSHYRLREALRVPGG
jgi:hypothetical protein